MGRILHYLFQVGGLSLVPCSKSFSHHELVKGIDLCLLCMHLLRPLLHDCGRGQDRTNRILFRDLLMPCGACGVSEAMPWLGSDRIFSWDNLVWIKFDLGDIELVIAGAVGVFLAPIIDVGLCTGYGS
jgi:hypothetical protein